MKSLPLATALAAALASPAHASIRAVLPRETRAFVYALDQITPRPTPAPLPPHHLAHRPRQRDDDDDESTSEIETAWLAPDNICGYINGRPGASFYCPASYDCLFFTAKATLTGAVACCNADACNLRITCMDYDQVVESTQCDDACMVDAFTLKCTNTRLPYCNTASFSSDIFDFWCNDVSISTIQAAETTYTGQTPDRKFTPLPLTGSVSSETGPSLPGPTVPDFGGDDDSNDNDGGGDSDRGDGGDDDGKKKKGGSAGAIAGGVVGGIAALGLIGLGALFIIRKKKGQKPDPSAPGTVAAAPAVPPQHPGPPGQPPQGQFAPGMPPAAFIPQQQQQQQHQSMYDPNLAAAAGPKQELPVYYSNMAPQAQTLSPVSPDRNGSTSPAASVDPQRQSTLISSPAMSQVSSFAPYGQQQQQQPGAAQMQAQAMMQQQGHPQSLQPGMQQAGYPLQQGQPVVQQQQAVPPQQPQHHRGEMSELA